MLGNPHVRYDERDVEPGAMVGPLRHRQTKRAETDMPGLPPPRHIPTLPVNSHSEVPSSIGAASGGRAEPGARLVALAQHRLGEERLSRHWSPRTGRPET